MSTCPILSRTPAGAVVRSGLGAAIVALIVIGIQAPARAQWPERPIEVSCFAAAGGGTDLVNRAVGSALEKVLGVKVNVVNRTGGGGTVAETHVWNMPHDGYSWVGVAQDILMVPFMGGFEKTAEEWKWFMVAGAPGVVSAGPGSGIKSLDDLVAKAKAHPGTLKAAAATTGSLWQSQLLTLEEAGGIELRFLPFQGSHPSQVAAMTGEVDVVLTSISEQAELIRGEKLVPLAMMTGRPFDLPGYGTIPGAGEKWPAISTVPTYQWLGFAVPADIPAHVLAKITDAMGEAVNSPEIKKMAEDNLLTIYNYSGEKADEVAAEMERIRGWEAFELGLTTRSPADFGVPRP